MIQANFMALCFVEPELLPMKVLHWGIGIFDFLLKWPWPWPDDLHIRTWSVFSGDIMNILRQGFRKLSSDRATDRQTRPIEIIIGLPRRFAGGQKWRRTKFT